MRARIIPLLLAAALLGAGAAHASGPFVPLAPAAATAFCPGCAPGRPQPMPGFAPASLLTPAPHTSYVPLAPGHRVGATHDPNPFPVRPRALS